MVRIRLRKINPPMGIEGADENMSVGEERKKEYDVGGILPIDGDSLPAGTNILIAGSSMSDKTDLATRILAQGSRHNEGALVIKNSGDVNQILRAYREHSNSNDSPYFVDCTRARKEPPSEIPSSRFESVSSPSDMTGIGIAFEKYIKSVGKRYDGTRVVFDSLTTLLQYTDSQRAYRFVDVLTGRFTAQGYLSVFIIDDTTVDEKFMKMLVHEFDIEVQVEEREEDYEISLG